MTVIYVPPHHTMWLALNADQSVTTAATLTDTQTNVKSGFCYAFEGAILYDNTSTSATVMGHSGPTMTSFGCQWAMILGTTTTIQIVTAIATNWGTTDTGITALRIASFRGVMRPSANGVFGVQLSRGASGTVVAKQGSWMRITQMY
jgi:hypothetical protein